MNFKKIYFITVLIAMIAMLIPTTQSWAGVEGGPPPNWDKVEGPELWGVAVLYCAFDRDTSTIRQFWARAVRRTPTSIFTSGLLRERFSLKITTYRLPVSRSSRKLKISRRL